MATELERLLNVGKELGLDGDQLREFVSSQQREERQRRAEEREAEKQRIETESERLRIETEEKNRVREFELQKLRLENERLKETHRIDSEREIELTRIESHHQLATASNSSNGSEPSHSRGMKAVKLPMYDEDDDIDMYLNRFERVCVTYGVNQNEWAIQLAQHLKGAALEVYQRMPDESLDDYHLLKTALLKRFNLSIDGYRKRFRQSQIQPNETPEQFVHRLRKYLTNWRELFGLDKSYEGLETLILRDQFLFRCSHEMKTFLEEKGKLEFDKLLECAESYMEAHKEDRVKKSSLHNSQNKKEQNSSYSRVNQTKTDNKESVKENKNNSSAGCYICGKTNHLAKDCYQRFKPNSNANGNRFTSNTLQCFRCKGPHRMAECPEVNRKELHTAGAANLVKSSKAVVDSNDKTLVKTQSEEKENPVCQICQHNANNGDVVLNCGCKLPIVAAAYNENIDVLHHPRFLTKQPTCNGMINGHKTTVMRDTGCSTVVVSSKYVLPEQYTGRSEACLLIDGVLKHYPTAIVQLDTPFFKGEARALCMERPIYDVIIGNVPEARMPCHSDFDSNEEVAEVDPKSIGNSDVSSVMETNIVDDLSDDVETELIANITKEDDVSKTPLPHTDDSVSSGCAVQTRSMAANEFKVMKQLKTPNIEINGIDVQMLKKLQKEDKSLEKYWDFAKNNRSTVANQAEFTVKRDILYRRYKNKNNQQSFLQLMVPTCLRQKVLEIAHDGILSGHFSNKKTEERITSQFYWSGCVADIKRFCWSCDACQRNISKGQVRRVAMGKMPLITVPFDTVCIDIIGPIVPSTDRGHKYILTLIDIATRYPDAVALKDINTTTVADALLSIYKNIGIPSRIHSDNGSQFTSEMMKEVNRLLSIKATTCTPYHAMGNGIVENVNKTIKGMLKKMSTERVKDWDRYLSPLLFALRDTPQSSTGFSPFELIYGRNVRGPMKILKELWTNESEEPEVKTEYQYVMDLRDKIESTCQMAREELSKVQNRNQKYYNRRARNKDLKVDDMALLLLPTDHNKLLLHWKGPFKVVEKINDVDYRIELPTGKVKTFHANMLKRYYTRDNIANESHFQGNRVVDDTETVAAIASVIEDIDNDDGVEENELEYQYGEQIPLYNCIQKETYTDVSINSELSDEQQGQMMELVKEYKEIFSDVPKITNLIEHKIILKSEEPIRCKMYPIPFKLQEVIDKEVEDMTKMNIIESSDASYSSPLVIVKKADGSNRPCVNFKALNAITVFDPEPMMNADDIFPKLAGSKFYSKFDFSKGYWQIPMAEDSKDYVSFPTSQGLKRFNVMPFGLVNAGSTYNRMMRKLLNGMKDLENYLDDVLSHATEWDSHITTLREFFRRVKNANLSLRPSKCRLGYTTVEFLGHVLTEDSIKPKPDAIQKIIKIERPENKRQVRRLVAMTGYYRKFLPNFAELVSPLTDLTRKEVSDRIPWTDRHEQVLTRLRQLFSASPILKLPDLSAQMYLQTDASDRGIGAVLLQEFNGEKHPIAYASRKLLDRESRNFTISEKECLSLVWAIRHFARYLTGNYFIVETDHKPLECLNAGNSTNSRIMRWSLALQSFHFTVKYIKGADNVIADYLSRL